MTHILIVTGNSRGLNATLLSTSPYVFEGYDEDASPLGLVLGIGLAVAAMVMAPPPVRFIQPDDGTGLTKLRRNRAESRTAEQRRERSYRHMELAARRDARKLKGKPGELAKNQKAIQRFKVLRRTGSRAFAEARG